MSMERGALPSDSGERDSDAWSPTSIDMAQQEETLLNIVDGTRNQDELNLIIGNHSRSK